MKLATVYMPTQAEIQKACSSIRQSWSPEERQRRATGLVDDLTVSIKEFAALATSVPHGMDTIASRTY